MQIISAFINTGSKDSELLTAEQELNLTNKYYKTRDINVRNKLVKHNLRLVFKIANSYPKNPELISEGCLGLMHGIEKFDPGIGVKLSTYVTDWIKAYMLKFILDNTRMIKVATTKDYRKIFWNLNKQKAILEAQGIEVTSAIIAEKLLVSEDKVKQMEDRMNQEIRLDAPTNTRSGSEYAMSFKHEFVASEAMTPDEALACAEREESIKNNFNLFRGSLGDSEKVVFDERFLKDATLQEVGDVLHVSRERVRQIEERVTFRFKRFAEAKKLVNII